MTRMQPCFQVAVKIGPVVAARPRAALRPAASRLLRRGSALFEHPGLLASRSFGTPVSVRPAVSGWAGMVPAGSQLSGGRSADRRWLSDLWPLDWSACLLCCLGTCSGGAPWHARGAGLWKAIAQQVGSFVGSCVVEMYSKKLGYQSGRPDLNRRPLDPQSSALPNCATSRPPMRTL